MLGEYKTLGCRCRRTTLRICCLADFIDQYWRVIDEGPSTRKTRGGLQRQGQG